MRCELLQTLHLKVRKVIYLGLVRLGRLVNEVVSIGLIYLKIGPR